MKNKERFEEMRPLLGLIIFFYNSEPIESKIFDKKQFIKCI